MSWPSRLLVFSAALAAGYAGWRWLRRQAHPEPVPSPYPKPLEPAPAPPADPPTGGVRRIPTRVHRGSPPEVDTASSSADDAQRLVDDDRAMVAAVAALNAQAIEADRAVAAEMAPEADAAEQVPETTDTPIEDEPAEKDLTTAEEAPLADSAESERAVGENGNHDHYAAPSTTLGFAPVSGTSALININTADLDTLISLPGIGPALARRIIAYRNAHGPFASVQALVDIPGIGTRNIEEFAHLVTV